MTGPLTGPPLGPLPEDDDQLLGELAEALRDAGPISDHDLAHATAAFTWRGIDEELALATLVYDSSLQERTLVRATSPPGSRRLVFEADTTSVEVDTTPDGLRGRILPPGRADVRLLTLAGAVDATTTDDVGAFQLTATPSGPVRLSCRTATAAVVTDWIRL